MATRGELVLVFLLRTCHVIVIASCYVSCRVVSHYAGQL